MGSDDHNGRVYTLRIGGEMRKEAVCGGHASLPFLSDPYERPLLALAVYDVTPPDHNRFLKRVWSEGDLNSRVKRALSFEPDLLCLRFISADPLLDVSPDEQPSALLKKVKDITDLPLIVTGCGNDTEDEEFVPLLSETLKGGNALLGIATEKNYRILAVSCLANGHSLIAETPLDINLAKQLNIMIGDTGLAPERVVMHHVTAALGYGLEYCYSILEKCRINALEGDGLLSSVMISFVGKETWKTREARSSEALGINWEVTTAIAYVEAGADIIVLDHPESIVRLRAMFESLVSINHHE